MRNIPNDYEHHRFPHDHLPRIPKPTPYSNIQRGTTTRIPVLVKHQDGTAVDLSSFKVYFTMKEHPGDMVYDDESAVVKKEFFPQDPTNGSFFILLSPRETFLKPKFYYFDIELVKGEGVSRLGTFQTLVVDGITNRSILEVDNQEETSPDDPNADQMPDNEGDVILVTEATKTDTIMVVTNFGQAPAAQNLITSVNGEIGDIEITPKKIGAYSKEEIDDKIQRLTWDVNGKNQNVKITLKELGGLTEEEIRRVAYDEVLKFYQHII